MENMENNFDVIIAGCGAAGLYGAINLPSDCRILLLCKQELTLCNSALAQGGIAGVYKSPEDSIELHEHDTMVAGGFTNNPETVHILTTHAAHEIQAILDFGVDFDRTPDGELHRTLEGGHSRHRIFHHKDATGAEILDKLIKKVKTLPNVTILEHAMMTGMQKTDTGFSVNVMQGGSCTVYSSHFMILATGGIGRVYRFTTNSKIATGDGIAFAYENGAETAFQWDCNGTISIGSQRFRCHDPQGHGLQNLADAMRNSCNPYFIALGQTFSGKELLETAKALGFGTETVLTSNMIGSSGTLPTLQQLKLPAEQANFSFGQGVLTATPLQITRMTCAIAGNGTLPAVRLVRGVTENGRTVLREETGLSETGISAGTAQFLRRLMCYTAADEDFQGMPAHVSMGAKTSTAQTGRVDESGDEYCHGWVTAFFPADCPQYAVTVLAEDGGYGNQTAAPVLRQIAAAIMGL